MSQIYVLTALETLANCWVAAYLKATTQADNRWLAKRLHLGALNGVSFHTGQLRRGHLPEAAQLLAKLYSDAKI